MARQARDARPGRTYHLVQRGHDRAEIFRDDQDRSSYFDSFLQAAIGFGLRVHAYCLLKSEAHWLVTPQRADAMADVVQQVGRSYVRRFNTRWMRQGTLWEGRYRAYWIDEPVFGLLVQRAIEWLPVRATLVNHPADWTWSSAQIHCGRRPETRLMPLPSYWALGNTPFEREASYPSILDQALTDSTWECVKKGLSSGRPWATERTMASLPAEEQARWQKRPRGRPRALSRVA
ncbi:MAG: transposase [Burkholderiaceae bacterium]|jgi:putative transposase